MGTIFSSRTKPGAFASLLADLRTRHLRFGDTVRKPHFLIGGILLVVLLCGCQKTIVYADPILAEPGQPISPFVQETHTWICAPSRTGPCTQQNFALVLPNVGDGDSVKVVLWWFAGQIAGPPSVSDSVNSAYFLIQRQQDLSGQKYSYIFSAPQVLSGGNTVTVYVALPFPTGNAVDVDALEYSAGANLDSVSGTSTIAPTPIQTGPLTISSESDVLLSIYFGSVRPVSACPACNSRYVSSSSNFIVEDFFPPSSGRYNAVFSSPPDFGAWSINAASFK
jgi:hypothetical protein